MLAILSILKTYGEVPKELAGNIASIKDTEALKELLKYAVRAKSISEFKSMTNL